LRAVREFGIILAVDSPARTDALKLISHVGPLVDGVKLGVPPLLANGTEIVRSVREVYAGPLLADLKVADIGIKPFAAGASWSGTNRAIMETILGAGIDYVICHTIVGTSSIQECVAVGHAMGGKVLTLPYMTHEGAGLFFDLPLDLAHASKWLDGLGIGGVKDRLAELASRKKEGTQRELTGETGWRTETVNVSDLILLLGEEVGVDGFIGPANHVEVLRDYRKLTSRLVVATGVGRQGGSLAGVFSALGSSSAAIVGHAISAATDPLAACKGVVSQRDSFVRGLKGSENQ
jgi:orotidine-5'-phosphate decarboxylase